MKKCLSAILAFVFIIGICFSAPITITANAATNEYLQFELNDDETGYFVWVRYEDEENISGDIIIPEKYDGLPIIGIDGYCFSGCKNITSITIPATVSYIGECAFIDCSSLTKISVDVNNPDYCDINGVVFNKDKSIILFFPGGYNATTYEIPAGVVQIGRQAFYSCEKIVGITIPNTLTEIGFEAFSGCKSLRNINIPVCVKDIGKNSFYDTALYNEATECLYIDNCLISAKHNIPENYDVIDSTRLIANYAFGGRVNLVSVDIPGSVEKIGYGAFSDCENLFSVNMSEGIKIIDNYAFARCENLANMMYIPESIIRIGAYVFEDTPVLDDLERGCTLIMNDWVIRSSIYDSVDIPEGVKGIADGAFYSNSIENVKIPDSVMYIGSNAFYGCLNSVFIPETVVSIGEEAFGYKYGYTDSESKIDGFRIYGKTGSTAEKYAIENGFSFFDISNPLNYLLFELNESGTGYIVKSADESISWDIVIPDTYEGLPVTEIGDYAFWECNFLTSVTIPNSVTTIGFAAFENCDSLTSITIPECNFNKAKCVLRL